MTEPTSVHGARAVSRGARARAHQPEPAGRRGRSSSADGVVVGQGAHERAGEPHAEVHALDDGRRARARRDAVLHARAVLPRRAHRAVRRRIVDAGIARVVAAVEDPNPLVSGRGFAYLRAHGVERRRRRSARRPRVALNQPFFTLMREGRPFVILKAATSPTAASPQAPGARTTLTSAAANRHAHRVARRGGRHRRRHRAPSSSTIRC